MYNDSIQRNEFLSNNWKTSKSLKNIYRRRIIIIVKFRNQSWNNTSTIFFIFALFNYSILFKLYKNQCLFYIIPNLLQFTILIIKNHIVKFRIQSQNNILTSFVFTIYSSLHIYYAIIHYFSNYNKKKVNIFIR